MIIENTPPNYLEVKEAFPEAIDSRSVIFAYDGTIYNPFKLPVGPQNVAHEEVHFEQQRRMGVDKWWKRYIKDPKFRADQELPAYRAEYRYLKDHISDRNQLAKMGRQMATNLSGQNYGECISFADAHRFITGRFLI